LRLDFLTVLGMLASFYHDAEVRLKNPIMPFNILVN
jgi:hypothetical protein